MCIWDKGGTTGSIGHTLVSACKAAIGIDEWFLAGLVMIFVTSLINLRDIPHQTFSRVKFSALKLFLINITFQSEKLPPYVYQWCYFSKITSSLSPKPVPTLQANDLLTLFYICCTQTSVPCLTSGTLPFLAWSLLRFGRGVPVHHNIANIIVVAKSMTTNITIIMITIRSVKNRTYVINNASTHHRDKLLTYTFLESYHSL